MGEQPQHEVESGEGKQPFVYELADETLDWMAEAPMGQREDVADEVWGFALATFVDGVPISPRGFDESDRIGGDRRAQ
jgi:hypothetical protein